MASAAASRTADRPHDGRGGYDGTGGCGGTGGGGIGGGGPSSGSCVIIIGSSPGGRRAPPCPLVPENNLLGARFRPRFRSAGTQPSDVRDARRAARPPRRRTPEPIDARTLL